MRNTQKREQEAAAEKQPLPIPVRFPNPLSAHPSPCATGSLPGPFGARSPVENRRA